MYNGSKNMYRLPKLTLSTFSNALGSRRLFRVAVGFFVLESLWIALSAVYPMAFDEDFHLGIIKIYAAHWSPFLPTQPAGADAFGAVARDPSYLYHYLMSFPYRVLTHFVSSQMAQVIVLRLINIAFFTGGLIMFRRLIVRALHSPALANGSLVLFILIPVVPQLAAQINYDNLLFLLMAWSCWLTYDVIEQIQNHRLSLPTLSTLLNVGLLTSLVKYAYLPVFVAICCFVIGYGWLVLRRESLRPILRAAKAHISWWVLGGFTVLTLVSGGLFIQRYGVNTLEYHTPIADCGAVLDYGHCSAYGPWIRNYTYKQTKVSVNKNPLAYLLTWEQGLRFRLFFAVNGPASNFTNYPPLPLPYQTSLGLAIIGLLVLVVYGRRICQKAPFMVFTLLAIVLYLIALFAEDFEQYLDTGQPVAINGRYLLPILFLVAILMGRGLQLALAHRPAWIKPALAAFIIVLFLQGGGVMTFVLRSDANWDWHNSTIIRINNDARHIVAPPIIEGSKYY